jgi:hypothetical protein
MSSSERKTPFLPLEGQKETSRVVSTLIYSSDIEVKQSNNRVGWRSHDKSGWRIGIMLLLMVILFASAIFGDAIKYLIALGVFWIYYLGWVIHGWPLPDLNRFRL